MKASCLPFGDHAGTSAAPLNCALPKAFSDGPSGSGAVGVDSGLHARASTTTSSHGSTGFPLRLVSCDEWIDMSRILDLGMGEKIAATLPPGRERDVCWL